MLKQELPGLGNKKKAKIIQSVKEIITIDESL